MVKRTPGVPPTPTPKAPPLPDHIKQIMAMIDEFAGSAAKNGYSHDLISERRQIEKHLREQFTAAQAQDDARFAMAAKVFRSQGGTVKDGDIRQVLDDCIAEEKRNQRPRIAWGKETRMWMCLGPDETIGYGDTPRIAFYNWQACCRMITVGHGKG